MCRGFRFERWQERQQEQKMRWFTIGVYESGMHDEYQVQARNYDEACDKVKEAHELHKKYH